MQRQALSSRFYDTMEINLRWIELNKKCFLGVWTYSFKFKIEEEGSRIYPFQLEIFYDIPIKRNGRRRDKKMPETLV